MAVTPSSIFSQPTAYVKTALSNCATFQTMCGVASAASALAYIKPAGYAGSTRPFSVVSVPVDYVVNRGGYSKGIVRVLIERDVPIEYRDATLIDDAFYDFANLMGAICAEFMVYVDPGANDATLFVRPAGLTPWLPIARSTESETSDYYQFGFSVNYGPNFSE